MTPAEFKLRYTEFASESNDRVQIFIDEAIPHLDQDRWGEWYTQGLGLYVAHSLAWENMIAAGGGAAAGSDDDSSVSVGDVSIAKSADVAAQQMGNDLLRTSYGQRYNRLRLMVGAGAVAL